MKWVKPLQVFLAVLLAWVTFAEGFSGPRTEDRFVSDGVKDNQLSIVDLQTLLATRPNYKANFQETHYSSLLTEPLITTGILTFHSPSRMEKHVLVPFEEIYVVDGQHVHFENPTKGISKTFSLAEYPSLQGFLVGIRSALTGDFKILKQFFDISLEGTKGQWTLRLDSSEASITDLLSSITITGQNSRLTTIEIRETHGDRSFMIIDEGKP